MEPSRGLLQKLALAAGAPGHEEEIRELVCRTIEPVGPIRFDGMGSVICEKPGQATEPRVVLDCHMDEVGFMVQSVTRDGYLKFTNLGGWWTHVMLAQRVDVVTAHGKITGVISSMPPHFLSAEQRRNVMPMNQLYIDVGARSREEVEELGVHVGDSVVPRSEFIEMSDSDLLSCKAFDNRVGVGVMCEVLTNLDSHPNTVIGVGACQEEVGCRGAVTASAIADPDVAIVLEGTPADDTPGFKESQAILGQGPQIRFFDPTAISNKKLVRFVQQVAADLDIPLQLAVRTSGGTNAKSIHLHGSGVPTIVIGVPARYIHTHVSMINWQDYARTCQLVKTLVERMDEQVVGGFTQYR